MGKPGPETRLVAKMRDAGKAAYGSRLVQIKYHGNEFGEAGVSDLLDCLDGVFVAAEVKAPESYPVKGKPSVERALAEGPTRKQLAFIARIRKSGGVAGVVATVEQYMALLAEVEGARVEAECRCSFLAEHRVSRNGCPVHGVL